MLDQLTAIEIVIPFLMGRESFRATAYQDGAGIWTYGYGHTAGVKEFDKITEPDARALLRAEATATASLIATHIPDELNPNQFAALISFTYNVGPGKLGEKDGFLILKSGRPSHLLQYVQLVPEAGKTADEFLRWIYVKGEPSSGLCTRRTLERKLYLTPYSCSPPGVLEASDDTGSTSGASTNSQSKGI